MNKYMGGVVNNIINFLPDNCTLYYYGELDFDPKNIHIEPMEDRIKEKIFEGIKEKLNRLYP